MDDPATINLDSNRLSPALLLTGASLIIVLILASAYFFAKIRSSPAGNFFDNGTWTSTKAALEKRPMGAFAFLVTKVALAEKNLNLGAWNGFQEVLYKERVDPSSVEFDFFLTEYAYFSFIFCKNGEGFSGIRLSNDERFDPVYFHASPEGEFLNKTALTVRNLRKEQWNHFKMDFSVDNFSLSINHSPVGSFPSKGVKNQIIGFRGSMNEAFIDNVTIRSNSSVIRERFEVDQKKTGSFLLFASVFLAVNGMVWIALRMKKRALFRLCIINISLFACVFILYTYTQMQSKRYPSDPDQIKYRKKEKAKIKDPGSIIDRIQKTYDVENRENAYRILFIGGSQTWGEGASQEGKTFVRVLERLLNEKIPGKAKYECINGGIPSAVSDDLLLLYANNWIKLKPKLVVINLSNNDAYKNPPGRFSENLQLFIDINKKNDIKTIFVLEPNATERLTSRFIDISQHQRVMRNVARKNDIPLLNMQEHLAARYDEGFLWWDIAHLTDFGQKLFADRLFSEIVQLQVEQTSTAPSHTQ